MLVRHQAVTDQRGPEGQTGVVKVPARLCRWYIHSIQSPETIKTPTTTSRDPPMMLNTRMLRRMKLKALVTQLMPAAVSRNGIPRPRQ